MAALAGAAFGAAGPATPAHGAHAAAATGRVEVTLALRPRHAALLARLAAASSARPPLPPETVRALFWPTSAQVARVRGAMAADGLVLVSRHGLDVTFAGPAPAVSGAFSARLTESRRANGSRVLRTLARPRVPASIAPLVQDVQGLDTQTLLHPLGRHPAGHAAAPCAGAGSTGGYLPSQLGSAGGYGHAALTAGGWDGHGERVAVVALSGYRPSDVAAYQACFGLAVPVTGVPVGGGGSTLSGSDEVELDVETVVSAAPGLDGVEVYMLKPTATMDQAVNAIVAGAPGSGVTVITDSWGVCEPALSPARAAATNAALQLAAVSGITFLAASGDSGLYDCAGFQVPAVDDPAAQLFATGVGGTELRLGVPGSGHEVVWNDRFGAGGGGLSRFWHRPPWQTGPGVVNGLSNGMREVPDLALHASVRPHGYPFYCTTAVCGRAGWTSAGGTSASAPLMAGIVADMNQYSRAHGGQRLGYANPFLYDRLGARPSDFRDITVGSNNPEGSGHYRATPFYDMASGIGAPHAASLAADLAAYVPSAPSPAATTLTGIPEGPHVLRDRRSVRLHGVLRDGGGRMPGARVMVQIGDLLGIREWVVHTDARGRWSLTVGHQIVRRSHWRAVYLGSQVHRPSVSTRHVLYVVPPLSAKLGTHTVAAGAAFRFSGHTLGSLARRPVKAQIRRLGGRWRPLGPAGVTVTGRYGRVFTVPRRGRYQLRWRYHGDPRGQWLSAVSARRSLTVI